jgi:acyl dehydratase
VNGEQSKAFSAQFDMQPFHLDEEAAKRSIFKCLAASSWHTAALVMSLIVQSEDRPAGGFIGHSVIRKQSCRHAAC